MSSSQGSPMNAHNGSDNEFWAKLEDMQRKYEPSLRKLFPTIRRLQERQPLQKQELFMKHLKDCFNILSLQRNAPLPPRLTILVLERAERFIRQVVSVYSPYVKTMANNLDADPTRRAQLVATIDEAASNGHPQHPGQNVPNQSGSRVQPVQTVVERLKNLSVSE